MPIYEFRCECGNGEDVLLPVSARNTPQPCPDCGEVMRRKISLPLPAIFRQTGRGMALDSLNAKGGGFPEGRDKPGAQELVAAGLDPVTSVVGRGF